MAKTVLIVEDDEPTQLLLVAVMRRGGMATIVAGNGAIRMPWVASVLKSAKSRMDDAISQEPGRELHKCRRSRET